MSQQIAEFYAKITADTTSANASLSTFDDKLENAEAQTQKTGGVVGGLKDHITGLLNPTTLAIGGLTALVGVVAGSHGEFQQYAGEVRDIAIASGTTAEESSVLLQVLDDYQITAGDVTAASRAMKEQGLVPTIDTLADLSDQFLAIEDPAKRLDFAQKNLGRSYSQFLNVLNQGGDVIRDNSKEVNKALILNDQQIKDAEEERLAMDALSDSWQGFKVQLGATVGQMILANERSKDQVERLRELDEISGKTNQNYRFLTEDQEALVGQMERGAAATDFWNQQLEAGNVVLGDNTSAIEANNEALELSEEQVKAISQANADLYSLMGGFADVADSYNEKMTGLQAEEQKLLAEKQTLISQGYSAEGQAISDVNEKLAENITKQQEATAEAQKAVKQKIVSLVESSLEQDGLTKQELDSLVTLQERWGLMSEEAADSARGVYDAVQNYLQTGDIDAFTQAVDTAGQALLDLPSEKTVVLNVQVNANGQQLTLEQMQALFDSMHVEA